MRINWSSNVHLACPRCKQRSVWVLIIWIDCDNCGWGKKRVEFR